MGSFADKVRAARKRAGLTQAQAAEILEIIPNTLARWERGERTPPRESEIITQEEVLRGLQKQPKKA